MATAILLYLNNLKEPLGYFTILGLLLCAGIAAWSFYVRANKKFAEPAYTDAHNRIWICLHSGVALAVIYMLIAAVPEPDYDIRIVERRVEVPVERIKVVEKPTGIKTVRVLPTYGEFYNQCARGFGVDTEDGSNSDGLTIVGQEACRAQSIEAMNATNDNGKPINEFDRVFRWCNDEYSLDRAPADQVGQLRNERLKICQNVAAEAVG